MENTKLMDIEQVIDELQEYLEADATELSDAFCNVVGAVAYPDYISEDLYNLLVKELIQKLEWFKKNTKLIESEKKCIHKVKELIYL